MIVSISHWGMFKIPPAGTDNFREVLSLDDISNLAATALTTLLPPVKRTVAPSVR